MSGTNCCGEFVVEAERIFFTLTEEEQKLLSKTFQGMIFNPEREIRDIWKEEIDGKIVYYSVNYCREHNTLALLVKDRKKEDFLRDLKLQNDLRYKLKLQLQKQQSN